MNTHAEELLLVAYQCGPGMGSVSQIGWQWFTGMARRRAVCLVTHVRNRPAIEAAWGCEGHDGEWQARARVVYIDTEWLAGPLYRLARRAFPHSEHAVFMLSQLDWFAFDAVALRTLRRMRRQGAPWRLLHLVTPVTTAAASRLHRLGLPVVRGPLNCGLPMPRGFDSVMRDDAMGLARLRLVPRAIEAVFGSLRHSAAVMVATRATRAVLPAGVRDRCLSMLENAIDPARFAPCPLPPMPSAAQPLRVAFVGRLVAVKALPLLLRAMTRLRDEGMTLELDVVGDGPLAAAWRATAQALGLATAVRWHGARDAAGVASVMQAAHLLCLPSVRESGGAVLLEAMACGRPVIAMDFGGPAEVVDESVGWKVPMPDEAQAIDGLTTALRQAMADPAGLQRRAAQALERARTQHTWAARLDAAEAVYAGVLTQAARRTGVCSPVTT